MQHLGQTRSTYQRDHQLLTPDTFVRAPLPGMERATAIVHVGPAAGAAFTEYTAELETGGRLGPTTAQRFIYVLDGEIEVNRTRLGSRGFAYLPVGYLWQVRAAMPSRLVVIEKPYQALTGVAMPSALTGDEHLITGQPLMGDDWLTVRSLLPAGMAFDMAVNTMTFLPGAALPMVEIHVMEHGLLMLEGGGIYRLGDSWYPVKAGDFIWMAPYCPQWFCAVGKTAAKYLIYKDWNRHPLGA